jgi:hypothetical protein
MLASDQELLNFGRFIRVPPTVYGPERKNNEGGNASQAGEKSEASVRSLRSL